MNPPLPVVGGAVAIKALAGAGFVEVSQRSSHVKLRKGDATVLAMEFARQENIRTSDTLLS